MKLPTKIMLHIVLLLVGRLAFGQHKDTIKITVKIIFGALGGTDSSIYIQENSEKTN
jgi:hypothetical protein